MKYLTSFLSYLFKINPGSEFRYYIPMIALAVGLIVGSIIFSIFYKKRKKHDFAFKRLFKKVSSRFLIIGIILLFLIALRYENIPYFSMRIWMYILLLALLYFIYKYLKILKVDYPREKQNVNMNMKKKQTEKQEKSYLPNKKKK